MGSDIEQQNIFAVWVIGALLYNKEYSAIISTRASHVGSQRAA